MKKPVDELELNDGRKKLLKKRKEREMKRVSSGNGSGIKMTKYATAKKPVDEFELHASYQKHLKKKRKEGERKKRMEAEFVPDIPETNIKALVEGDTDEVKHFTGEEIEQMKTQHESFLSKIIQKEKEKVQELTVALNILGVKKSEYKNYKEKKPRSRPVIDENVQRRIDDLNRELGVREKRIHEVEEMYTKLRMQKEEKKKGKKRLLPQERKR